MTSRIIHHIKGQHPGPTVVFFGGVHGNEPAGVIALSNVLKDILPNDVAGNIYGIYGNIKALKQNKRFLDVDLNRIWTKEKIHLAESATNPNIEEKEQQDIFLLLRTIINQSEHSLYFIDIHTTSSKTLPFITINDAIINRKFSKQFPCPIVLGIEEYLDGPLLSYLNTKGYVSLGFEAGQHQDPKSITCSESFIYLSLIFSGVLKNKINKPITKHYNFLKASALEVSDIFEVIYKYNIKADEKFIMQPGFSSFQKIETGDLLATSNDQPVKSAFNYRIFMPLYQKCGKDGFFIIRKIPGFFLLLSLILRRLKIDHIITYMPGISWHDKSKGILKANLRVSKYLVKPIFHLLGYRNKQMDKTHLLLYNRDRVSKLNMYRKEAWY